MYTKKKRRRRFLVPDAMIDSIYDITPELLKRMGFKGLVLDIDNTLVPYSVPVPDEKLIRHLRSFQENGIKLALVSNNKRERVVRFNGELDIFAIWKSGKPFGRGLRRCVSHFGVDKDDILAVGDQIYTDCLGAHSHGVRCFIVSSLDKNENAFFRLKRFLEKPIIKIYDKSSGE